MKALAYAIEVAVALLYLPVVRVARAVGWRPSRTTIVGWWGSETVGDVAILGQLLREIAEVAPGARPCIVSFDAALTRDALAALGRSAVPVLPLGWRSAWALVACRALVFGGGPLMESPSLPLWAWRARMARLAGARVMLYGNGIGPLRGAASTAAVVSLLRSATQVALRDAEAVTWARAAVGRADLVLTFDPAFDFVRTAMPPAAARRPVLALALRAPPARYLGITDAAAATAAFVDGLAAALDDVLDREAVDLHGLVMHAGHADSDDRAIYAQLRERLRHADRLHVEPDLPTPAQAIAALRSARAALTVRFHAMVFALATETPFVAIDYARPTGKVSATAADAGRADAVVTWDALRADDLAARILRALHAPPQAAPDVQSATARRCALLRDALA